MPKHIKYTDCSNKVDKNFLIFINHEKNQIWMFEGENIEKVVQCVDKIETEGVITYNLRLESDVLYVAGAIDSKSSALKYIASDHYIPPTLTGLSAAVGFSKIKLRKFLIEYFPKLVSNLDKIDADINDFCAKKYFEIGEIQVIQKSFLHIREEKYYDDINLKISKKRAGEPWSKKNISLSGVKFSKKRAGEPWSKKNIKKRAMRVLTVTTNKNSITVLIVISK